MTEAEWLACRDPDRLRSLLWPRPAGYTDGWVSVSDLPRPAARRLRLFGVACVRELGHLLADGDRTALVISERYADGFAPWTELVPTSRPLATGLAGVPGLVSDAVGWAVLGFYGGHPATTPDNFHMWEPFEASRCAARALAKEAGRSEAFFGTRARQAEFIRDFTPPRNPAPVFSPSWRTSDVLLLVRGIYEERAFDRMPILADALQDAGCDSDDVLNHCRGPGPHVRGCWVVDLVLGKE